MSIYKDKNKFHRDLVKAIKKFGFTKDDLAAIASVTVRSVERWLRKGGVKNEHAMALYKAFNDLEDEFAQLRPKRTIDLSRRKLPIKLKIRDFFITISLNEEG